MYARGFRSVYRPRRDGSVQVRGAGAGAGVGALRPALQTPLDLPSLHHCFPPPHTLPLHSVPHFQFAELLDRVAGISGELRVRFTSPHPKDFSDDVLQASVFVWGAGGQGCGGRA